MTTPDTPATEAGRQMDMFVHSPHWHEEQHRCLGYRLGEACTCNAGRAILAIEAQASDDGWTKGHESGAASERGRIEAEARSVPTRPDEPLVTPVTEEEHGWHICEACVHVSGPLTVERLAAAWHKAFHGDGRDCHFDQYGAERILAALGIGEASK